MEIDRTTFGTITIDGKIYEHDVIIRVSGEVVKRHLDPSWALVAGERYRWARFSARADPKTV
jgi:hypothetical protein